MTDSPADFDKNTILRVAPGSETRVFIPGSLQVDDRNFDTFRMGHTRCKPDYYCLFEKPSHLCFMYFAKGSGTLTCGSEAYTPKGGDLFILRPHRRWEYKTDPNDPWELLWLNCEAEVFFVEPLLETYGLREDVYQCDEEIVTILKDIFRLASHVETPIDLRRDDVVQKVVRLVQAIKASGCVRHGNMKQIRDAETVKRYINTHITETIRREELCRLVFRSESSLSTIFRKIYGCTIQEYILRTKLDIAAQLLIETTLSVTEIAGHLSFYDAQYMSRLFRTRHGFSPLTYRKIMWSKIPGVFADNTSYAKNKDKK